jgi:hypothetical protein
MKRLRRDNHDDDGPIAQASLWSRFWFNWNKPLLHLGLKRPLEASDLARLAVEDQSRFNRDYMEDLYRKEQAAAERRPCSPPPSLARAVARDFFYTTWPSRLLIMLNSLAKIGQALALGVLLDTFEETRESSSSSPSPKSNRRELEEKEWFAILSSSGYFWAAVIVLCGCLAFPTKQHSFFQLYRKGAQYRTGFMAAIYAKTLRLSSIRHGNRHGTSAAGGGHVTNLASNDVERFVLTAIYANILLARSFVAATGCSSSWYRCNTI